jgi:hypothetical protein
VPEVVELERSAVACVAVGDCVAVEEDLDRADVAGEVAGVGVGLGELGRGDPRVVLRRAGAAVSEPGLLAVRTASAGPGVVELGRDRRSGAVAGDRAADVLARDPGLAAQHRDEHAIQIVRTEPCAAEREHESTSSPVLGSVNLGCAGRHASQPSIASPMSGSTGFVPSCRPAKAAQLRGFRVAAVRDGYLG